MRKDLEDATKRAQDAMNGFVNLAEYLRRDCLEISGVPPSESYTCNITDDELLLNFGAKFQR